MLKKLSLENFRNHLEFKLILDKITVLVGPNGAGKSNVLEAISVLSSCRSFREDDKKNLVSEEADFARVKGDEFEVFIQRRPTFLMRAKAGGVFKRHANFIGCLKSVIFSPETMLLVTGSPSLRRKFIDIMICQKDREYLRSLISFEKIRKERNALLQAIREGRSREAELAFWDEGIISEGRKIIGKRQEAIDCLNKMADNLYQEISGNKNDSLEITYSTEADLESKIRNHKIEIIQGRTLFGPHRDDLLITLNGKPAASFASRGEIRSAVLALKVAELNFLKDDETTLPILLLDDVFSEFDEARRSHLGKLITGYQAVITTTDKSHLSPALLKEAKVVELGAVSSKK